MKKTKEELIELVKKLISGQCKSEEELENLIEEIESSIPGGDIIELVFYHKPKLTPEEIVEKALSYKPIVIPPYENEKRQ